MSGKGQHKKIPVSEYKRCAAAGMSGVETAKELGVWPATVRKIAIMHEIKFRDGRKPITQPEPRQAPSPVQRCASRPDLSRDLITKIHRMNEVGHPVGVIEMVTGVRRVEVMRVLGVLDAS